MTRAQLQIVRFAREDKLEKGGLTGEDRRRYIVCSQSFENREMMRHAGKNKARPCVKGAQERGTQFRNRSSVQLQIARFAREDKLEKGGLTGEDRRRYIISS